MKQTKQFLIYGATGYTGKLTARTAKEKGLAPILAGRNEAKVKAVAEPLGLQYRAVDLAERPKLDAALSEVDAVLHIAGPFSATSRLMADACLRTGTHYLDITGEIDVFEALAARDADAKAKGVMLLPGVGFDVVPSDCLAAHLKRRLPDATDLKLYIGGLANMSRGTGKTMVEGVAQGTRVRRDGKFVTMARANQDTIDFGEGPKPTIGVSWGDVSTAYYSTKIPNIEVHFGAMPQLVMAQKMPGFVKSIMAWPFVQGLLKAQIDRMPEGPTDEQRRNGRAVLIGVATNAKGERVRARLTTGEGYTLTAMTGLEIARRVVAGEFKPGFQTPSLAFGPDFVLGFDGVRREELNA
jgi:short subunit dehydrogenase-like uncharacterized protein